MLKRFAHGARRVSRKMLAGLLSDERRFSASWFCFAFCVLIFLRFARMAADGIVGTPKSEPLPERFAAAAERSTTLK